MKVNGIFSGENLISIKRSRNIVRSTDLASVLFLYFGKQGGSAKVLAKHSFRMISPSPGMKGM
jgi:hypothetical protein